MTHDHFPIIAIVQARMSSKRLPGKVLYLIHGKSLLQYLLDSLKQVKKLETIIVTTSIERSDDPIFEFCEQSGIACWRGELTNVASRYYSILQTYAPYGFVRICGDSPLLDFRLVEQAIEIFLQHKPDLVTNVQTRTFPSGQSVEVMKSSVFREVYALLRDPEDQEHVTRYCYQQAPSFNIQPFTAELPCHNIHLSVDTVGDLKLIQKIVEKMNKPHWQYTWLEVVGLYHEILSHEK
ncbi:MAG: hypothetical protein HY559_01900 [Gammaproteobacteria bacterium]|nr:hypothetical protein [Gammaproteobacteria bacterium]